MGARFRLKGLLWLAAGPAIVRELRLRWSADARLRLFLRYDGANTFAVNSPVDRFFGPFQGVSFYQHATNDASCYLPMPFRAQCEVSVRNDGTNAATVSGKARVESIPVFSPAWGYFHARHQKTEKTDGHRLHQVLYVRGRGHWVGMTLYRTGHDHGGSDFAVIDGEGDAPAFLHGVNREDYFTFAWFGKGAHHPYAVAHSNDEGRYRHHLENLYPFHQSIAIEEQLSKVEYENICFHRKILLLFITVLFHYLSNNISYVSSINQGKPAFEQG